MIVFMTITKKIPMGSKKEGFLFEINNIYLRWEGVHDENGDQMDSFKKLKEFHRSPLVRMTYHFVNLISFLFKLIIIFS